MYTNAATSKTDFDYSKINQNESSKTTDMQEAQDRFLKLLVKQLQSQDPMNPMENAEMTSQIAQINTVTGIEKLNTTMATLLSSYGASQSMQAAALVGKQAMAPQEKFAFDGTKEVEASVTVPDNVSQVAIAIIDKNGKVVDQMAGTAKPGEQLPIEWNGKLADGTVAPAGDYYIVAKGLNGDGKEIALTVNGWQTVKSVEFGKEGVNVNLAGGSKVKFEDIVQVM
ncbi:flagellar hook assembly protein FlgD [Chitinolyticbacter meiyuanensis]|uniref:flagellar hook assembly protein FlgD n=1 Tax=Chitinolyticbacter meiyuanensis TaxID=682798 RepID=UPI0011E59647|nr:flagellar hook assembly protein FlgD [Chitinolyticbacter meiyuanensis]